MTVPDSAKPIILSEWSVNRILSGQKRQTRRVMTPQPPSIEGLRGPEVYAPALTDEDGIQYPGDDVFGVWHEDEWDLPCPYGKPGDLLWAREAFRLPAVHDDRSPSEYVSRGAPFIVRWEADDGVYNARPKCGWGRLRPSIHMPKALSRLLLRIESIDAEPVQEIRPMDAWQEGIQDASCAEEDNPLATATAEQMVDRFRRKWDEINAGRGYPWEDNPVVWVVRFSVANLGA
jgi:hypothetical protein